MYRRVAKTVSLNLIERPYIKKSTYRYMEAPVRLNNFSIHRHSMPTKHNFLLDWSVILRPFVSSCIVYQMETRTKCLRGINRNLIKFRGKII